MARLWYRWRNRKHASWLWVECHEEWWRELVLGKHRGRHEQQTAFGRDHCRDHMPLCVSSDIRSPNRARAARPWVVAHAV
jgi:hypothetical protein